MKFLLLLISLPAFSATTTPPEETNYYYQEIVPRHKIVLEFEYPACAKLTIEPRYSMGEVENGRVRNVILRGRLDQKCTSGKKSFLKYEVDATDKLMTHAFIIVDKEVRAIKMESR